MVALLILLAGGLSETVDAWYEFQRTDIGYFLHEEGSSTNSPSLKPLVGSIDKTFSNLRLRLRKLEGLLKELDPQGVSHPFGNLGRTALST